MKKINAIIFLTIVLYLGFAYFIYHNIKQYEVNDTTAYRVEMNRIMNEIQKTKQLPQSVDAYTYIQQIDFLDAQEHNNETIQAFYVEENDYRLTIQPWVEHGELLGYVKFLYQPTINVDQLLYIFESVLLLIVISLLIFLYYIKKHILMPFEQLQELPLQLAKGHYKSDVKVQKSKYMNRFLWGLGQLKDSLDTSKKRQLDLEKEKKQLLLSLSHDVKTPLNLIRLYAKALEENVYEDQASQQEAIHQVGEKAKEIERYVEAIVTSSREDILDLQVIQGEFYLADVMNHILTIYQPQCDRRNIDLQVQSFENRLLKGDIERSQEVFENIFENIFKYGDGRRIEISFYEEEYCQLIRIFNTGQPVNDTEFNHIFDSFFRGANSKGKEGSGLGLYICRELMQKMDGAIFAQTSEDGMAFVLVFR